MRIRLHKWILLLLTLLPVVMVSACSHQLSRSRAADLIKSDPDWKKPLTAVAKIGGVTFVGADMTLERKLESLGYVKVEHARRYYTWAVETTPKGDEAIRAHGWILAPTGERAFLGGPAPAPTPQTLTIPIGSLHLVDVTGIKGDDQKATAEFKWRLDCNDISKEMGCPPEQSSQRSFTRYDSGWRLDPVN